MKRKKRLLFFLLLFPGGILLNYILSRLCLELSIPLFLDCYGTVMATLLGGPLPGIIVGYAINLINGMSDPITLYYSILSVLIALATVYLARKGCFDTFRKCYIPILSLTFIGGAMGSVLTWVLYGGGIGSGISAPYAIKLLSIGLPDFWAQLIADISIDLVDKAIVVALAVGTVKLIPQKVFDLLPYTEVRKHAVTPEDAPHKNYRVRSLRNKVIFILVLNSLVLSGVAIFIGNYLYRSAILEKYIETATGVLLTEEMSMDIRIFNIKLVALLFAAAIVIVMAVLLYCDIKIVAPINTMTLITEELTYNDPKKKEEGSRLLSATDIRTGDEIENLFRSLYTMAQETDKYVQRIREDAEYISHMQNGIIASFADMVESRDENTGEHIKHTATYVKIIAETLQRQGKYTDILNQKYIGELVRSAPLHDVGKIKIPDFILNKPGKLTAEEFSQMKTHTTAGRHILDQITENVGGSDYLTIASEMAAYHHEWWNGKGYPEQLAGEQIPLSARIMALADVFDALVSKRSYKDPFSFEDAMQIITEESGTHFDPTVVNAFLSSRDQIFAVKR